MFSRLFLRPGRHPLAADRSLPSPRLISPALVPSGETTTHRRRGVSSILPRRKSLASSETGRQGTGQRGGRLAAVMLFGWANVTFGAGMPAAAGPLPITGPAAPGMERVDAAMQALMAKYHCPGGQIAVTRQGRLVLARGYGFADRDQATPVEPDALFRIASLSKLITATAILQLVEQKRLSLDARAFALLPHLRPPPGAKPDRRLADITVRHLLQHTGGWDRSVSGDPMFQPLEMARAAGAPAPASADAIIRAMLGRPLDFAPGTKYAYSNFGYNVLGRIIEAVSGETYAGFVAAHVLGPAGAGRMQQGRSLEPARLPGEVKYYADAALRPVASVFSTRGEKVPVPYGGFNLEAMDAHGAWVASAIDYVRLLGALDGTRRPALLSPASLDQLTARPAPPVSVGAAAYYGCGIQVRPIRGATGKGANWWHGGSLAGTTTYQVRLANGWSWAAFFNSRPKENSGFSSEIDRTINAALASGPVPASEDFFGRFR
jgi:CubicO group peptidase (beta-lactamase class C family)